MREQANRTVATLTNGVTLSAFELECPFANTTAIVSGGFKLRDRSTGKLTEGKSDFASVDKDVINSELTLGQ
jgi:hypothetical protein